MDIFDKLIAAAREKDLSIPQMFEYQPGNNLDLEVYNEGMAEGDVPYKIGEEEQGLRQYVFDYAMYGLNKLIDARNDPEKLQNLGPYLTESTFLSNLSELTPYLTDAMQSQLFALYNSEQYVEMIAALEEMTDELLWYRALDRGMDTLEDMDGTWLNNLKHSLKAGFADMHNMAIGTSDYISRVVYPDSWELKSQNHPINDSAVYSNIVKNEIGENIVMEIPTAALNILFPEAAWAWNIMEFFGDVHTDSVGMMMDGKEKGNADFEALITNAAATLAANEFKTFGSIGKIADYLGIDISKSGWLSDLLDSIGINISGNLAKYFLSSKNDTLQDNIVNSAGNAIVETGIKKINGL